MSENEDRKSLLNMPEDELRATMKRLSRYTLAIEMVPIGACLPIFTRKPMLLLPGLAFTMIVGLILMSFCAERKQKRWLVVKIIQSVIAVIDVVTFILTRINGEFRAVNIVLNISFVFIWIHCALCFFDYRKDEELPFMRVLGAITVVLTVIVCYIAKQFIPSEWLF